jgi:N-acetylneuraminic acid mutarotase
MSVDMETDRLSHPRKFARRSLLASLAIPFLASANQSHAAATPESARPTWRQGVALPAPNSEFAAAVIGQSIFVAGGFGMATGLFRFDAGAPAWLECASLPQPRHHAGLAAMGGFIYLAGGHDHDSRAVDTFWRYDPEADAWQILPSLPQGPRGALGLAALGGRIYAVGGSSGDLSGPATADCACFDPDSNEWSMRDPMPTRREHLAIGVARGMLVAIGGRNGSDVDASMAGATEVFDPANGTWTKRSALPVPRSGMGVASTGDAVIVLGGEGEDGVYDDVNRYDPHTNTWDALAPLPSGRHGVASAYVGGFLYTIGGSALAWQIENIADVDIMDLT